MFHYPISVIETHQFLHTPIPAREIEPLLQKLVAEKRLFKLNEYYSLRNDHSLVIQRRNGNDRAGKLLPAAYRIGKLLQKFPFVKGVGISGSLSKNYADAEADFDFFIITEANKLWIARSLLHGLKKISFIFGKQHWLCMNYFVDEEALELIEKNIFIATEVVTLKPVALTAAIQKFFSANKWTANYFPNHIQDPAFIDERKPWGKKLIEAMFNNRAGSWLDDYLMRVTEKRWLQKEKLCKLNMKGEVQSLRVSKHFARPNPEFFQKKILALYDSKLKSLEQECLEQVEEQFHFLRKEII